jgi:cytochrome c oxidase subunit II
MVVLRMKWTLVALMAVSVPSVAFYGQDKRVIRVSAERFAFTPSQIEVDAGEEVEIRIKSDDTSHGFRIIGMETNVAIPKRGQGDVVVALKIDKPGRYIFECSRMCGAGHNFMRGELVVRDRARPGEHERETQR